MMTLKSGSTSTYVRTIALVSILFFSSVLGQTNPSPQALPYTQNFGTAAFSLLPPGFGAWNGISGAATISQAAAEASVPKGDATVKATTVKESTGGIYGYEANGNAMIYVLGSTNATNGACQLMMAISTKGATTIKVNYTVTMVFGSTNTASTILQCRAGTSGTWTSVANSVYQGNSTTRTAGQEDSYTDLVLPVTMENKDTVQLRWAFWRGSESGTGSIIGIDDISIFSGSGTTAPSAPTLTSLADNAVNEPLSVLLAWNASSSATSYRVQIASNAAFTPVWLDSSHVTASALTISGLSTNTQYYWRVSASNTIGNSDFSIARTFSTVWTTAPAVPAALAPANGSTGYYGAPVFSWVSSPGAMTYRCQVATDSAFAQIVLDDSTLATPKFQSKGLTGDKTYWWRVRSKNTVGSSPYSPVWSFTTAHPYQVPQQILFAGRIGQTLNDSITAAYTAASVLDYAGAREKIYGEIDKVGDTLKCVYSGFACYMTPGVSAITAAGNGGMNAEHTFPQSMGAATGNANSDMHHIYAANGSTNSARSNWPFAEIPDANVTTWYRLAESRSTKPSGDLGEYSKFGTTTFEPRDAHKGHVARAIFYFYTIYKAQATASFFEGMKQTLLKWHSQFPVDSAEYARTLKIAVYQSGKANPFILDTTLVRRIYAIPTDVAASSASLPTEFTLAQNYPNPFNPSTVIGYTTSEAGKVSLMVFDVLGREVARLVNETQPAGSHRAAWNAAAIPSGVYFYRLSTNQQSLTRRLVIQK
jgi:hypothetical protein